MCLVVEYAQWATEAYKEEIPDMLWLKGNVSTFAEKMVFKQFLEVQVRIYEVS